MVVCGDSGWVGFISWLGIVGKDLFECCEEVEEIEMGLMERCVMGEVGKLVEVVGDRDEVVGDG